MEITTLVKLAGDGAVMICGGIFLVATGLFFLDRSPVRKDSAKNTPFEDRREELGEELGKDRRRAA